MKALLEQIGEEGLDLEEELTKEWIDALVGTLPLYRAAAAGRLHAHLTRSDDVVLVSGDVRLPLQAQCGRCLEPVPVAFKTDLQVTMVPKNKEPAANEDGEISEEDIGVATYEDRQIDLERVVHDEVLLELPMQVVCKSDCLGLCASCGKNLNEQACGCQRDTGDLRLSKLAKIKLA